METINKTCKYDENDEQVSIVAKNKLQVNHYFQRNH